MPTYTKSNRKRKNHGIRVLLVFAIILFAAIYLVSYIGKYPKDMFTLFMNNPEARSFVIDYPSHIDDRDLGEISSSELSEAVPHFLQWDERWGYYPYGSSVLGITGCGPTCLSMVAVGLTGNSSLTPAAVAAYSTENGLYVDGVGSSWDLLTLGAQSFGLVSTEIGLSEEEMAAALNEGHPLIASLGPGDFTKSGHFIVITGYYDGKFTVNDPNSKKRSEEDWYFSTLAPQIRCLWAYAPA